MNRMLAYASMAFVSSHLQGVEGIEPQVDPMWSQPLSQEQSELTEEDLTARYDFSGIVKLSNCSASLVRFEGDEEMNKPALVLTNGHCISKGSRYLPLFRTFMPAMGEVLTDVEAVRSVSVYGASGIKGRFNTTKIVYATMTDTDLALYETDKTYQEIKDQFEIEALVLAQQKPEVQSEIEIISGYWNRGYSCNIDKEIFSIKEDEWIWKNSIKYSKPGCETIGGTSGSPILDRGTREIIGVNNTGNEGGTACTLMNPCEIDEDGNIISEKGSSYGQQTYQIYSCLEDDFGLNLDKEGCELPKNTFEAEAEATPSQSEE